MASEEIRDFITASIISRAHKILAGGYNTYKKGHANIGIILLCIQNSK